MKNSIKIKNSCSEKWEEMRDTSLGKFCQICSKNVFDFTENTNEEIKNLLKNKNGIKICGRVSLNPLSKVGIGIVLLANLSCVQVQLKPDTHPVMEQKLKSVTLLSGKLILKDTGKEISDAEVFLVSKNKILKTISDRKGNFSLEIPDVLFVEKNVLYLDFSKLNEAKREAKALDTITTSDYQNQAVIFTKNEKPENREYLVDYRGFEIGAVVIVKNPPPNYYYFDGNNISKNKFKKLREKFPHFQMFSFEGKVAKAISNKSSISTLHLLYSN